MTFLAFANMVSFDSRTCLDTVSLIFSSIPGPEYPAAAASKRSIANGKKDFKYVLL